jgi:hypothetical protein
MLLVVLLTGCCKFVLVRRGINLASYSFFGGSFGRRETCAYLITKSYLLTPWPLGFMTHFSCPIVPPKANNLLICVLSRSLLGSYLDLPSGSWVPAIWIPFCCCCFGRILSDVCQCFVWFSLSKLGMWGASLFCFASPCLALLICGCHFFS